MSLLSVLLRSRPLLHSKVKVSFFEATRRYSPSRASPSSPLDKGLDAAHEREVARILCLHEKYLRGMDAKNEELIQSTRERLQSDILRLESEVAELKSERQKLESELEDVRSQVVKLKRTKDKIMRKSAKKDMIIKTLKEQVTTRSLVGTVILSSSAFTCINAHLEMVALLNRGQAKSASSKPFPRGVQSVLDEIIKGVLDDQSRSWAASRQDAISRIDPNLDAKQVDAAGLRLYYILSRYFHGKSSSVYVLREDLNSIYEIVAVFALVHFSRSQASVNLEYRGNTDALGATWP
ncbi:hypothetical protein EDD85DRAFT_183714 [Armillaria nabsnona]|nr:hypothetical protein EDD85DRAFT_183714 [Armillaria nabsnona]